MQARSAPPHPDTRPHALALAMADSVDDDREADYSWIGYEAAHPIPDAFVLPAEIRRGERDVD